MMTIPISPSEGDTFNRCEMAHYFNNGLGIVSRDGGGISELGSLGHEMLAAFYRARKDGANFDDAAEFGRQIHDDLMMEKPRKFRLEYFNQILPLYEFYVKHMNYKEWEILEVEKYYSITYPVSHPLTGAEIEIRVHGLVDLLYRPLSKTAKAYGKLVVGDHKFVFNFLNIKQLLLQSQVPKYIKMINDLQIYNETIEWGCLNQVRYRELKEPKYPDLIYRDYRKYPKKRLDNIMNEHFKTSFKIDERRKLPIALWPKVATRTLMKDVCKWCDFARLCDTEMDGGNTTTEMAVHFEPKDVTYREMRKQSVVESPE